jgi:hypothetical protein
MTNRIHLAISCLLLACGDDGGSNDPSGTTTDTPTTMSTSMSSTTQDPTGSSSSGDPTSSEGSSGSESGSGSGSGSESGTGTGSESGSGAGDVCAEDPTDTECFACTKEMCCDDYAACAADPDCICTVECGLMGTDPAECLKMCNNPPPGPAMALGICAGTTCMSACIPR